MCAKHIGPLRVIVAFPAEDQVVVLKPARHDNTTDPYAEPATELGIAVSTAERMRPACCTGDRAPVDQTIIDRYDTTLARLARDKHRTARY